MIAMLIFMPSCAQVDSSHAVIWKPPSPAITQTSSSGRAKRAPIAAGSAKPIVPRPPEVIELPRLIVLVVLRLPHLVLADVGDDERAALGEPPQVVHDVRGEAAGRRAACVWMSRTARVALAARRCARSHARAVARAARAASSASSVVAHVADERDVDAHVLVDLGADRSRRGSSSRCGAYVSSLPVTRSSKRMPSAIEQIGLLDGVVDPRLAVHAHHAEASGWVAGKPPSPSSVDATGMPVFSTNARSSSAAPGLDDAVAGEDERALGARRSARARALEIARRARVLGPIAGQAHRRVGADVSSQLACCASLVMSTSTGPGRPERAT